MSIMESVISAAMECISQYKGKGRKKRVIYCNDDYDQVVNDRETIK